MSQTTDRFASAEADQPEEEPPASGGRARPLQTELAPTHLPLLDIARRAKEANRRPCSDRTVAFRREFYPLVGDAEWNDWRRQVRYRLQSLEDFDRVLQLSPDERSALSGGGGMLPVAVTPYYMSLLDRTDPTQGLRRTVLPTPDEWVRSPGEAEDPLGEEGHSPVR